MIAFLLLLIPVLFATPVHAQVCNGRSSESQCYGHADGCHWTGTTCAYGAPATCEEMYRDTVTCSQNSATCIIQTYNNNRCATRCPYITGTACVGSTPIRQDCRYNYATNTCYESTANIDGCSNAATITQCNTTRCVADPFVNNCFASMQQINQVFPCRLVNTDTPSDCISLVNPRVVG
jgi:hypothetical protein